MKKLKMQPEAFWALTPFELGSFFEGYAEEKEERIQELIYLAWHVEAFARQKKLPSLAKLLKGGKKTAIRSITTEQLIKIAQSKGLEVPLKWR